MHIIACMTRQALNELIATLQRAQAVRFVRASASQLAGRLLCEFEAPDQDTLLRFLEAHNITYEWIIRVEMRWEGEAASPAPREAGAAVAPEAGATAAPETPPSAAEQGPEAATAPAVAPTAAGEIGEATILHILRRLKDESAWQIIAAQRQTHPVAVLLMHDAVLAPPPLDVPMYACAADVQARGITPSLPQLSYEEIVDLIFACERVMVW
jgi:sulfur transfer complex TusBCD TusB component (DsrH family)